MLINHELRNNSDDLPLLLQYAVCQRTHQSDSAITIDGTNTSLSQAVPQTTSLAIVTLL